MLHHLAFPRTPARDSLNHLVLLMDRAARKARPAVGITTFDKRPIVGRLFFVVSSCREAVSRFLPSPNAADSRLLSFVRSSTQNDTRFCAFPDSQIFRRTINDISSVTATPISIFIDSTLLLLLLQLGVEIREPVESSFRETLMVRVRISIACTMKRREANGARWVCRAAPFCAWKLMPKRADARWIPSNYTHR